MVDKRMNAPVFSSHEIDLTTFRQGVNGKALDDFFAAHLDKIWKAEEGLRTRAANFTEVSKVSEQWEFLKGDYSHFYQCSRALATHLYESTPAGTASAGILLVLVVHETTANRDYLALLKMEPGASNTIWLPQQNAGQLLMEIAVQHLDQTLPESTDKVLKWAVIPHPSRQFNVKLKDAQGGADVANYFIAFLGCTTSLSEDEQSRKLTMLIHEYVQEYLPQVDRAATEILLSTLKEKPVITSEVVVEEIEHSGNFPGFDKELFQKKMAEAQIGDLQISDSAYRNLKVELRLPGNITISGPRGDMERDVQILGDEGDYEIRIKTTTYRRAYV